MAAVAETAALQFLAAHLASNRACVSGSMLLRVLHQLAAVQGLAPAASTDMTAAEREAVFCDVVSAAGSTLNPVDQQQVSCLAHDWCWLAMLSGMRAPVRSVGERLCSDIALQAIFLARRVSFKQAEARVRHTEGLHAEALACLAGDLRSAHVYWATTLTGYCSALPWLHVRAGTLQQPLSTSGTCWPTRR